MVTTDHGVRIVFHSMSCLQTTLISILYKQSLQWWFQCMRLQEFQCWFGMCWGHDTDVSWTGCARTPHDGFGNSTRILLRVSGRWRSTGPPQEAPVVFGYIEVS